MQTFGKTAPLLIGALSLIALTMLGCRRTFNEPDATVASATPTQAPSRLMPKALALWNDYASKVNSLPMQEGCKPMRLSVPAGVAYRGVVVLFHSFSACPKQLAEWAPMLANIGYEVLLPTNPGHGLESEDKSDNLSTLPKSGSPKNGPEKYMQLADKMNEIVAASNGEKIIGGISLGATIAAYALNVSPGLYSRALLITPLFGVTELFRRQLSKGSTPLEGIPQNDPLLGLRLGWGDGCVSERETGRAGYCEFEIGNALAAINLGTKVKNSLKDAKTQLQILGVEDDPVSNLRDTVTTIKKLRSYKQKTVSACFFRGGVNRSSLPRFDAPTQNRYWLNALFSRGTEFIANGTPYPEENRASLADGFKLCLN